MKMNFKPRIANNKDEAFTAFYQQICCGTLEPVAVAHSEASTGIVEVPTASTGVGEMAPMWPGFDSRTQQYIWVEFVFLPPQKSTILKSNLIWKQWMKSHLVEIPLQIPYYDYHHHHHHHHYYSLFRKKITRIQAITC